MWQIRQAPINVQNVITYDVVIAVSNQDLKLFPGMTANVKILVDKHNNVLKVPNAALRFRPEQTTQPGAQTDSADARRGVSAPTLWVLQPGGRLKGVPVQLGLADETDTEITGGELKEGDDVVTASFAKSAESPASPLSPAVGPSRGPRF